MNTLITYDVNIAHGDVKSGMIAKGYMKTWKSNTNVVYYLPNTTLWKDNTSPSTTVSDIKSVIANLNRTRSNNNLIKLERCIAVEFTNWDGIPGDSN